jgi:hypothetical protein
MRRTRRLLLLVVLLAAACARPGATAPPPGGNPADAFTDRATQVAAAWRAATGDDAWRNGFVPLDDLTVLAPDPGFDDDTKQAFLNGWFRSQIDLSERVPPSGTIRYARGDQRVPLTSAADAYAAIDRGDPPPCPRPGRPTASPAPAGADGAVGHRVLGPCIPLTVTRAELGTTTVRTSRGPAQVPAWLFTIAELPQPIARVAVAPSAVATPPTVGPAAPTDTTGLVSAQDLVGVDGARLTYRLGVGACDKDITPLVYETDDVVVVGGSVTTSDGMCVMLLKLEPVTVTLRAPLGARPVLDALSGQGLTLTRP